MYALNNLSNCFLYTKDYAQAEHFAHKGLELDNTDIPSKINLAQALLFQNRYEEAESIYKELTLLDQTNAIPPEYKANLEKIKEMMK